LASASAQAVLAQQLVPVEVEVADDRHADAELRQPLDDRRHRRCSFLGVHRHPDQLGAGDRQRPDLQCRRLDVGGVGVGHGLHDHRMAATHGDGADADGGRLAADRLHGLDPAPLWQALHSSVG